ncbi:DNA-processing protein DprA [Bifidobacterium parmae]|uniref:SMF family protein n=1 Tax=Bifidobacterium parmae TaxID=361854 RepID=A0A2N5IW87_9BIFI|nr:DNA-processing protein DprA [Bifidobacterium parmae]PLS26219.1 SMF family protein [Bifidobacterium parmae]
METPHSPTERRYPPPDRETLARATLTYCLDGADAIMYATIKGAGSGTEALRLIIGSRPGNAGAAAATARRTLDHVFAVGLARWGSKVTPQGTRAFHKALAGWHARLDTLPTLDWEHLDGWFTMDGAQWIIGPTSPYWPHQLQDLSTRRDWASPLCLWGVGDVRALVSCAKPVAIVGSRGATDYGRAVARDVAMRCAASGHLIVSGGALGTDAAAHWGALAAVDERVRRSRGGMADHDDANPANDIGRTVAVFAGGLNHIGPSTNLPLFERMVGQGGALISELCPGTIPEARRFLLRNRIIAALASTVVVAQARLRSGALSTANWANDLNREVIAVPGPITMPHNAGCNRIIADHQAMLLASIEEIDELVHPAHKPELGEEPWKEPEAAEGDDADGNGTDGDGGGDVTATASQRVVLTAIRSCRRRHEPVTCDTLLARLREDDPDAGMPRLLADLGELEARGLIRRERGEVWPVRGTAGT